MLRQLPDILIEKSKLVGGKAALGRVLGITGEAVLQYIQGRMPSFEIAIKWKLAFNENLIDLLFEDDKPPVVAEPETVYNAEKELIIAQRKLIDCQAARLALQKELNELKNFVDSIDKKPKLKK